MPRTSNRPNREQGPEGRPKRVPMDGSQDVLVVEGKDPDYVYRMVNDIGNRIQRFEAAWWEFANGDELISGGDSVGTSDQTRKGKDVGKGVRSYLMKIKKEYFEEDTNRRQGKITQAESAIFNPNFDGKYGSIKKTT